MSTDIDRLLSHTLAAVRDRHVAEHGSDVAALRQRIIDRAGRRRATKSVGVALAGIAVAAAFLALPTVIRPGGVSSPSTDPAGAPVGPPTYEMPFNQARIERENQETREYVACMRERGWPLPEPTPWEGAPHPGLLDPPLPDPGAADRYYLDSTDCGVRHYDENDNLLP